MDKKTLGILLIVLLILLCGCPGLCIASTGVFTAYVGSMADLGIEGFEATGNTFLFGTGGIIIGLVFVAITIGGIVYAAKMMKQVEAEKVNEEELPPTL
jgi:hypothetical protein